MSPDPAEKPPSGMPLARSSGHAGRRLIACASLIGLGAWLALPARATTSPATTCSAPERQVYAIAAGGLGQALDALALQSDLQIVYSPELVTGAATRGVSGRLLAPEALQRLLAGTKLVRKRVNGCTFILLRAQAPAPGKPPQGKTADKRAARTLPMVMISGSLFNNARIQTATPTHVITAASIKARGFGNLAQVLQHTVFANGSVQGPQHFSSFTQGAQAINFYGLGPQFTLILVDGKPLADFGRLYNGSSNFNSLSNIPLSMIERIDVMPGGSSSIHGSQAVAGVVNIITRQHLDGAEISVRAGGFPEGGGASRQVAFGYGGDHGRLNVLAALELGDTKPIWGYHRALIATGPAGQVRSPRIQSAVIDYGTLQSFTGAPLGFVDPPAGCDNGLYKGSTLLTRSPANTDLHGRYCGSDHVAEHSTLSNQSRSYHGMLKLRYGVSDSLQVHGNFMLNWQRQQWSPGLPLWQSRPIEDADSRHIMLLEKGFAPEELPGHASGQLNRQMDLMYRADIGATGRFGESNWDWDIYYLRSGGRTEVVVPLSLTDGINAFFEDMIGPAIGVDPQTGLGLYRPDYETFFRPITPAQYASFSSQISQFSETWVNSTRATITNTRLFGLPGGDAGLAFLVEGGSEAWYAPVDPRFTHGEVYLHTAIGGGGRRSHLASAFELNLPVLEPLTLDLSGRFDRMRLKDGSDNGKFTYKIGIEYRPLDTLLLRANYSTVFKAPDLAASFLAPSQYYRYVNDYYLCALAQAANCEAYSNLLVQGTLLANAALRPTTARTWTAGMIWSPSSELSVNVDYLHIAIRDEVAAQDQNLLMKREAECRLDPNQSDSPECQSIIAPGTGRVRRAGADGRGALAGITTQYDNLAQEIVDSIIAGMRYRFALTPLGGFDLKLDYNTLLRHDYRVAPGQPFVDRLADPIGNYDFKDILTGSIGWTSPNRRWRSTLYGRRLGSTPNLVSISYGAGHPDAGRLHPWITFNWTLAYALSDHVDLSLSVNNVGDRMPPEDASFVDYPYFNYDNYNAYGREIMLQATVRFGENTH